MNDKLTEAGRSLVRVPAVDEQQLGDVRELREREVSRERSLHALLAHDADAGARRLDHGHVVAAIAD